MKCQARVEHSGCGRFYGSTACLERIPRNNSIEVLMAAEDVIYSMEDVVVAQMALRRAAGVAVDTLGLTLSSLPSA